MRGQACLFCTLNLCQRYAYRHARLGSVQSGTLLLIGQRVQTGRPYADDACAAKTSSGGGGGAG